MEAMSPLDEALLAARTAPATLQALYLRARQASKGKNTVATFETVFTSEAHPFDTLKPKAGTHFERFSRPESELLHLSAPDGEWVVGAFPTRHDGVFQLVSGLPATARRWKATSNWVNAASNVSRCYIDHDDFSAIGDRLSEFGDVEVVRLSARKLSDGSAVNRSFRARPERLRPSHLDLISESEDFGASVRTLELVVSGDRDLHVHLRRLAGATFYSGDFDIFCEQVLSRLEDATATRLGLVSGRARQPHKRARPLSIYLPQPILRGAEDTAEVIALVQAMPNVTLAVFHRNPYLHMAATDEVDGSNFDVMVTRADMVDIYPGFRASPTALAKFAQAIGERLGALRIADPPVRSGISLNDLVDSDD